MENTASYCILVVEDDAQLKQILVEQLKSHSKFEIRTATNGRDALEVLNKKEIHIVISDMQMPEMDGLSLLREIMVMEGRKPPVILMSADPVIKFDSIVSAGAYYFLPKPFHISEIMEVIEKALQLP